jgi:phosphonoacetaldehyde hydrolase
MAIKLAILDMAGTTVNDLVNGVPLVLKSYKDAFERYGVNVPYEVLNEQRGRDKYTVIRELGGNKANEIYEHFHLKLLDNIQNVKEIKGVSDTLNELKTREIRVVASTGFPQDVARAIVDHLNWIELGLIDYWISSETVGVSRPDPAMILWSMRHFGIGEPSQVIKVDDTVKGIEEGKNAGVHTVAVLTGTQSIKRLSKSNPDTIIKSITELPDYIDKI